MKRSHEHMYLWMAAHMSAEISELGKTGRQVTVHGDRWGNFLRRFVLQVKRERNRSIDWLSLFFCRPATLSIDQIRSMKSDTVFLFTLTMIKIDGRILFVRPCFLRLIEGAWFIRSLIKVLREGTKEKALYIDLIHQYLVSVLQIATKDARNMRWAVTSSEGRFFSERTEK